MEWFALGLHVFAIAVYVMHIMAMCVSFCCRDVLA